MTPCIETTWLRDKDGYGHGTRGGKSWRAHRWAWTQKHGPIPASMLVLHHCDNPPCINDEHLFLGDSAANMADMAAKGRSTLGYRHDPANLLRGERHPNAKLSDQDVLDLRASTEPRKVLAERYGIHPMTVSKIRAGLCYRPSLSPL